MMSMMFVLAWTMAALVAPPTQDRATHAVEWTDPAGDVRPISTSDGSEPGFDVVKAGVSSDGTAVTLTATLVAPYTGTFASDVLQVYLDTDNDPNTGAETFWSKAPGFEFKSELAVCVSYEGGGMACSGGLTGSPVSKYEAVATLEKLEKGTLNTETLVGSLSAPRTPIEGAVVSARLTYEQLGMSSGQTVRVLVRESNGAFDETGDFPTVLLTLK
jgi:hypothetical protein